MREDGAQYFPLALSGPALQAVSRALAERPTQRPGVRLGLMPEIRPLLTAQGTIGSIAAAFLGNKAMPVRAILFDKSEHSNWALGWHQDRTIAVRGSATPPNFGTRTVKDGVSHIEPPFSILKDMITLRVHLDPVPETNAPLLIARGSHKRGRIAERDIGKIVAMSDIFACVAGVGDVWAYATPILHASARAERPSHRRVLSIDFAAGGLPLGLDWYGV